MCEKCFGVEIKWELVLINGKGDGDGEVGILAGVRRGDCEMKQCYCVGACSCYYVGAREGARPGHIRTGSL